MNVLNGGKQTFYQHVNSFNLTNKNFIDLGMVYDTDNVWKNMMRLYGDVYIGERGGSSYIKYDNLSQMVEIRAKGSFLAPKENVDDPDVFNDVGIELVNIASKVNYAVEIKTLNGTVLRNGQGQTTLVATVYKGGEDVTETCISFKWTRTSSNSSDDIAWDNAHQYFTGNSLVIMGNDVDSSASFSCDVTINN